MPCHDYVMDVVIHSLPMEMLQVKVLGDLWEAVRCVGED